MARVSSDLTGRCARCHSPLRPGAKHCHECGEKMRGAGRRLTFYLGIAGIVVMLLVVALGLWLTPNSVENQFDDVPQGDQQSKPSPPPKEPPLNR